MGEAATVANSKGELELVARVRNETGQISLFIVEAVWRRRNGLLRVYRETDLFWRTLSWRGRRAHGSFESYD